MESSLIHPSTNPQGTTGGDREKLLADVQAGGGYAVIAPNMAKQIVALQVRKGVGGWVGGWVGWMNGRP